MYSAIINDLIQDYMAPRELCEIHNHMLSITYHNLLRYGRVDLAHKLQEITQDRNGAFILHELIQVIFDLCMKVDEPKNSVNSHEQ